MRFESSVTSVSWIPSEAMTGPLRLPMDLGIGHYDDAPPDHVEPEDLEDLRDKDRFRFANYLAAWVDVEEGEIVDSGYSGSGYVGSTTARLGVSLRFPGVSFPLLQDRPHVDGSRVTFRQTAGGRTGAPLPHRIGRPPYVRVTAPTAWTTLTLSISSEGTTEFELTGASPFPRHWVYGPDGDLTAKSGIIDFGEWTRIHDHTHTPWHDFDRAVLMTGVESQVERNLSTVVMSGAHDLLKIDEGSKVTVQGDPANGLFLILDGMLQVTVDGQEVAELGPGAIVGERALLEGGTATATVTAITSVRAARVRGDILATSSLEEIAAGHRREEL